ncbi:MAG: hypothetical protein M1821_003275 [Bathelium mastoideum]|nr:MAG: hypothetical protein M1821_003275 [Bathelium mastoideum]
MSVTSTNVAHSKTDNTNATIPPMFEASKDQQNLDALVDRIAKLIPPVPYVPSIPQDKPKPHYDSFQSPRAWCFETPFCEREHPNLQYMTFLYQDPTDSCIQLHNMDEYDPARPKPQSNRTNGIHSSFNLSNQATAPKKKMTIADYKKKQINGGGSMATQQRAQDRQHSENEPRKEDSISEESARKEHSSLRKNSELKREEHVSHLNPRRDSPPPAKKRRISPPPVIGSKSDQFSQSAAPADDPLNLPSSPVSMDIPSIPVSLDLPSFITNELATLEKQKPSPVGSPSPYRPSPSSKTEIQRGNNRTDSPLQNQANGLHTSQLSTAEADNDPSQNLHKNSHAHPMKMSGHLNQDDHVQASPAEAKARGTRETKTGNEAGSKTAINDVPSAGSHKNSEEPQDGIHVQKPKGAAEPRENRPRMRKIIKLKIRNKTARKDLAKYLKLPPKSWSSHKFDELLDRGTEKLKSGQRFRTAIPNGAPLVTDRSTLSGTPAKTAEKRLRPTEDSNVPERSNKRLKVPLAPDVQHESSTPLAPSVKSPTSNPPSAQKLHNTPHKGPKSIIMQRIGSTESVHTPHGSVQTPPASSVQPEQVNQKRDPGLESNRQIWKAENARLSKLGAMLKHSAENKDGKGEKNSKVAAVKMLESFLCFLLAFVCNDNAQRVYNQPPALKENTWLSLQKFALMALQWAKPYPHLYGLAQQLVVVLHSHIATLAVRIPTNQWLNPSMLAETMAQLQHAAASGAHRLPIQELTEKYPQTCKKAVDYITQIDHGKPEDYSGEYTIPLSVQSTPLQAVRFGVVFLKEWLQLEKLSYELQLKL